MEQPAAGQGSGETQVVAPEQAPAGVERSGSSVVPQTNLPAIAMPLPPATAVPAPSSGGAAAVQSSSTPAASADDRDLIEKEWVIKAKQIVESNREDPYKQSEELTVFKADYLQKNYGKNIKLSK